MVWSDLRQWRVAHPETGAHVFRDQFNGVSVADGVFLRQILHRFDKQSLPIYVPRIRSAFPALIAQLRRDCNRKNLSHE